MRKVLPIQKSDFTPQLCCYNRHPYPNPELGDSDDCKTNRDGNVFHRYSIHPAIVFSGIGSETPISKRNSGPDGQHNLRDKRATDKHKEGAPRGPNASVFMECEKADEIQSLPIEIRTPK
jgi:hypothetical protein